VKGAVERDIQRMAPIFRRQRLKRFGAVRYRVVDENIDAAEFALREGGELRDRGRVEAVARGFTAMDKTRNVTFRADRAMIALDSGSLLSFKVHPRQLRLEKGTATVVRSADGVWTLADMVFAQEPAASDKPFDPIRDINWPTLATPIRALISAGAFEQVELVDFHLDVDDRKSHNVWSASPVAGVWKATKEGVSLSLDITLANAIAGEPNRIRIALASVDAGDVIPHEEVVKELEALEAEFARRAAEMEKG
jgi:hypothetical protein